MTSCHYRCLAHVNIIMPLKRQSLKLPVIKINLNLSIAAALRNCYISEIITCGKLESCRTAGVFLLNISYFSNCLCKIYFNSVTCSLEIILCVKELFPLWLNILKESFSLASFALINNLTTVFPPLLLLCHISITESDNG